MSTLTHFRRELSFHNLIALLILLATAFVLWPLAPKPNANVSGIFLPSAPLTRPSVAPDQVQILQMLPSHATILGNINTEVHYSATDPQSDDSHVSASTAFAQKLAGSAGANAIVITQIGRTYEEGPLDYFGLVATAISES